MDRFTALVKLLLRRKKDLCPPHEFLLRWRGKDDWNILVSILEYFPYRYGAVFLAHDADGVISEIPSTQARQFWAILLWSIQTGITSWSMQYGGGGTHNKILKLSCVENAFQAILASWDPLQKGEQKNSHIRP